MKKLVSSLLVVFILIMTLAGGCVRSAADGPADPAASTACSVASPDDPWELERFLDPLIAERTVNYDTPGGVFDSDRRWTGSRKPAAQVIPGGNYSWTSSSV
jgi:hypothetical protein